MEGEIEATLQEARDCTVRLIMILSKHCFKLFENDCCAGTSSFCAQHQKWDEGDRLNFDAHNADIFLVHGVNRWWLVERNDLRGPGG